MSGSVSGTGYRVLVFEWRSERGVCCGCLRIWKVLKCLSVVLVVLACLRFVVGFGIQVVADVPALEALAWWTTVSQS